MVHFFSSFKKKNGAFFALFFCVILYAMLQNTLINRLQYAFIKITTSLYDNFFFVQSTGDILAKFL